METYFKCALRYFLMFFKKLLVSWETCLTILWKIQDAADVSVVN